MEVRPLLRVLAIAVLVIAVVLAVLAVLAVRASRGWRARRASGIVAGGLAVAAMSGFVLSALDLLAPRAPLPDSLSVYYVAGDTLEAASAATGTVRWRYTPSSPVSLSANLLSLFDNGVFYLRTDGALRTLRARDGQQLWAAPVEERAEDQQLPASWPCAPPMAVSCGRHPAAPRQAPRPLRHTWPKAGCSWRSAGQRPVSTPSMPATAPSAGRTRSSTRMALH